MGSAFWGAHSLLFAAALGMFTPTDAASAEPLPKLVVRRTPDALDCPDSSALAAAVERQMKRPALEPVPGASEVSAIDVQVLRGVEGYTATVQAGGRFRQISDPGPTCAGLAEGLAITLAILLDSEDEPAAPPPKVEAPAPSSSPSPPPSSSPSSSPSSAPAPSPPKRAASTGLTFHAGVGESAGIIGPLDFALEGGIELRVLPSVTIGIDAFWLPTRTIDFAPGTVDVTLVAGVLRACLDVLGSAESARMALCLAPSVGALRGQGSGYPEDRSATRPWRALGVGGLLEGPIWRRLGWSARVNLLIPLGKEGFSVDGLGVAYDPAQAGVLISIGPRVTIW